jgi:HlyD family secretion protein
MDKRKRKQLVSRLITYGVLLGVAILIGLGFVPKPVPVTSAKVTRRDLEVTIDEPGKTRVRFKYVISAPVTGQLSRIRLQAGDSVEASDVVAEIAPLTPQLLDQRTRAEARARVNVAQANLARSGAGAKHAESALSFARDEATRERKLHAQSGTSAQALERAEYQQRSAEDEFAAAQLGARVAASELEAARAALASVDGAGGGGQLQVSAPVRGQVLRVVQESEGVVQAGAPLLEIGDPSTLEIVVDVLSADAVRIRLDAAARIERWGGDYPLAARVRRKQPSAFTTRSALGVEEQRVPVLLDLREDPARYRALGDGYRVEAHIRVASIQAAVVAPASALFRDDGGWAAFYVRDGKAWKTKVASGARTPDWVEVKQGLTPGQEVVLYPSDQVRDGVKVTRQPAPRQ